MQKAIKQLLNKNADELKPIFYGNVVLVLIATLIPTHELNDEFKFNLIDNLDKIVHVIMFVVLTVLLQLSYPRLSIIIIIPLLIGFGIMIEFLQHALPTGRSFELIDWVADIIGVFLGIWLTAYYKNKMG